MIPYRLWRFCHDQVWLLYRVSGLVGWSHIGCPNFVNPFSVPWRNFVGYLNGNKHQPNYIGTYHIWWYQISMLCLGFMRLEMGIAQNDQNNQPHCDNDNYLKIMVQNDSLNGWVSHSSTHLCPFHCYGIFCWGASPISGAPQLHSCTGTAWHRWSSPMEKTWHNSQSY